MIPKHIIRTCRSRYLFTPAMEENERILRELHPNWIVTLWNHHEQRDWVMEHTPEWMDLYNFYSTDRQREQLFGWLAVWKLGGFLVDTRLRPLKSFESLRSRSLVIPEKRLMSPEQFERMHKIEWDQAMPRESLVRVAEGGFGAAPGHWFAERVLDIFIGRAALLDGDFKPEPFLEEFTTGAGVVNAAWLSCVLEGLPMTEVLLSTSAPHSGCDGEEFGVYGRIHLKANV